jgi:flagellar protein FliO/FliZ
MKYFKLVFAIFVFLLLCQSTVYAAASPSVGEQSVYDAIQKGEGTKSSPPSNKVVDSSSPSLFPLFIKFIASFILVVALLIFLLRYLSKRSRLIQPNGPVLNLGGHVLGNNRSVQVLLIGKTIYIIGVGEDINLIQSISQGEEYQHLLEGFENQSEGLSTSWLPEGSKKKWDSIFRRHLHSMNQVNREE